MRQDSAITTIKGIGAKTAEAFARMGVYTVGDILLRYPQNYVQYPKMRSVDEISFGMNAVSVRVKKSPVTRSGRKMQVTVLAAEGEKEKLELVWYRMPYIKNTLTVGRFYVFYGKIAEKSGKYVMEQPAVYEPEKYQTMQDCFFPVYSLTAGITNNLMIKTLAAALSDDMLFSEYLPASIRSAGELCEYNYAMKQIHFPDTMDTLITARRRLVFDEFFLFIMGMQYRKRRQERQESAAVFREPEFVDRLKEKLPFALTGAQERALSDMQSDMSGRYMMQRLIQGDVGSGKTVLAFLMMAWASHNGFQSAIMAPTEVLARQHYDSFIDMSERFGLHFPVVLLTGSMTARQKRSARERLMLYENAMVIGTHALIQEQVDYANLALVITDEQHRFGVRQRDTFAEKGLFPHILVMSATPIPRTLAIILYGDLDISVVDEVPARRLPVKNCVVGVGYRPKAYDFIAEQVRMGHQSYIVCPLVEASENMEGENVNDYALHLLSVFGSDIVVGVLHGKLKNDKKNEIMEQFAKNEIQVLVSTTVVEVGVNVPNATVMMIENAERFGLAQLHQLRGRVGRGSAQSYCIMVNTSDAGSAKKRLEILNRSNDGFFIAGEDLKLRGPGDFFGIRQSGEIMFRLADIYQDADVLQRASEAAKQLLEEDPSLSMEENAGLREQMDRFEREQLSRMNL